MLTDYGKTAYVKVQELEKKLQELEKGLKENAYKSISYDLYSKDEGTESNYKIKVNGNKGGSSKITVTFATTSSLKGALAARLYVNDALIKTQPTNTGEEFTFSVEVILNGGENEIKLSLIAGVTFKVEGVKITVDGYVGYLEVNRRITKVSYGGVDYVAYLNGDTVTILTYTNEEGLISRAAFSEVKDAVIGGVVNDRLYMVVIDKNNSLRVTSLSLSTFGGVYYDVGVTGVNSVAAYPTTSGIKILFIKLDKVFSGEFIEGTNFSHSQTGRRGTKVFADADCAGIYVIATDCRGSKLVIE